MRAGSCKVIGGPHAPSVHFPLDGAQAAQVDEPLTTFVFELIAYPEAKALSPAELRALHATTGSFYQVGDLIGTSEAFARQNAKQSKRSKN